MATRRPKVPRADALGGQSSTTATPSSPSSSPGSASVPPLPKAGKKIPATPRSPGKSGGTPGKAPSAPGGRKPTGVHAPPRGVRGASKSSPVPSREVPSREVPPRDAPSRDDAPVPAKAFSGRLLALAVVMIAITIMLTPTVRIFLEKRAEISDLQAQISSRQAEQADLNKQLSRWQDPNYVKQQARDRINMVMPGETDYWVFGADSAAGTPGGRTGSGPSANPANLPWVDALWESIRRSATD